LDPSTGRIIIVDDDRMIRRIVVTKLSGLGYAVEEAEDGQEALEKLKGDGFPDLLITDQLMPRMNGLQLVRMIRDSADPAKASLPIIMLTSKSKEQDVIEGLEVGMDDYISKPFSPDELAARVRTVLWRARRKRD
jgi:DNA-binding response OmpR family regulator